MILVDDRAARQLGHAHDAVGIVHTVLLDAVDGGVDLAAGAVEVSSVHMDAQRFAAHHLGMHAGGIRQPVVRVDNVELLLAGHHACDDGEVVDLIIQVGRIAACKLHAADVIDVHVREIGIDMVAQVVVRFRRHAGSQTVLQPLQPLIIHIAPNDGHLVHADDVQEVFFIAARFGHTERGLHVSLHAQALRDAVSGDSKAAVYLGRKFPSEH